MKKCPGLRVKIIIVMKVQEAPRLPAPTCHFGACDPRARPEAPQSRWEKSRGSDRAAPCRRRCTEDVRPGASRFALVTSDSWQLGAEAFSGEQELLSVGRQCGMCEGREKQLSLPFRAPVRFGDKAERTRKGASGIRRGGV